uniref:Geminin coiled-coil domain containing n=1 Tax=Oryzias sinensis TaxID=183150 RepID=A0A8C7YFR8_9TELE
MATPTSVWAGDTSDLNERRHELCGPPCVWSSSPPAGWTWEQQFSPHLQRNKQLQDALLQREEELARLQEENCKLREFLSSSFVKSLQEKAEVSSNVYRDASKSGRRTPPALYPSVCRNLMAEFCSETQESPSEPNLDLWVLRTLGLKDRDTIDTPDLCSITGSSPVHSPDRDPAGLPFWSPPPDRWTPPENVLPPPLLTSTPTSTQPWVSPGPLNRTSPSDHPEVRTPRRSTDVAFSMFLRPSSSVKTHSFPQGQAFVRRDTGGRCNFTWVPRQEP